MANDNDEPEVIVIGSQNPVRRKYELRTTKRPRLGSWKAKRSKTSIQAQAKKRLKTSSAVNTRSNTSHVRTTKRQLFSARQNSGKGFIKSAFKKPIPILLKKATTVSPSKHTYGASLQQQQTPSPTHRKKTPRKSALVATPDSRLIASARKPVTRSESKTVYGVSILTRKKILRGNDPSKKTSPSGTTSGVQKTGIENDNNAEDRDPMVGDLIQNLIEGTECRVQDTASDVTEASGGDHVPPSTTCDASLSDHVSDSQVTQSASTLGGQLTQSVSVPNGKVTQCVSTPDGQLTQPISTPNGQVTQSALTPDGHVTQSASTPDSQVNQSDSTPVTSSSQSVTTGYIVLDQHNRATQFFPADTVKLTPVSDDMIFLMDSSNNADTTTSSPNASPVHSPEDAERPSPTSSNEVPAPSSDTEMRLVQGPQATFDADSGNLFIPDGAGGIATYHLFPTSSDEKHKKALNVLCRICGLRCLKYPMAAKGTGLNKFKYASHMLKTYKIDVMKDDPTIDPLHLCLTCSAAFSVDKPSNKPVVKWTPHGETGTECIACYILIKTSKGGRRPKAATVGWQRRKEREAFEKKQREEREALERQRREEREALEKQKRDVEAACDKLLCSQELVEKILNTPESVDYKMNDLMNNKLQKVTTMLVKCLLKGSEDGTIELPTGGPKLVMRRAVKPKVPSSKASAKTVRNRNRILRQEILKICRPSQFVLEEEECLRRHEGLLKHLNIPNADIITQENSPEKGNNEAQVFGEKSASVIPEEQSKKKKSKKRKPDKSESQSSCVPTQKRPQKIVLSKTCAGWKQTHIYSPSKTTHGPETKKSTPQTISCASQGIPQHHVSSGEQHDTSGTVSFPVTFDIPADETGLIQVPTTNVVTQEILMEHSIVQTGESGPVQVPTTNVVTQEIPMEHSIVQTGESGPVQVPTTNVVTQEILMGHSIVQTGESGPVQVPTMNVVTQEIPMEHLIVQPDRPGESGPAQVPTTNVVTQEIPMEHSYVQSGRLGISGPMQVSTTSVITQEIPVEHSYVPPDRTGGSVPIQVPNTNVVMQEIPQEQPFVPLNRPAESDTRHVPTTNVITQELPQEHPMYYEEQVEIPGYGLVSVTHRFEKDKSK